MELKDRRILILDDDQINSVALGKRLDRRGLKTSVIADPDQLFDILEKDKIELLLLDIVMPKTDGMTILKKVREKFQKNQLPVIMVTALNDSFDIVDAFKFGANDYITKPVNVDVAMARIQAHLSIVDLYQEGIQKKELEAVNSLITTYNHEINNPLTIALACLEAPLKDEASVEKLRTALWRVADIVKKIKAATNKNTLEYETYSGKSKMLKVK